MKSWPASSLNIIISLLILLPLLSGCKKDGSAIRIEGFDLVDISGNPYGHQGPADNDWTFNNILSEREMALFDFPISVTLDNTAEATLSPRVGVYPNPAAYIQWYSFNASDSVVVKIVVTDNNLRVLQKIAFKRKGFFSTNFDYSDRSLYPNKSSYRVYFSFSATDKPNFKAGYGDIRICEGASPLGGDNCF